MMPSMKGPGGYTLIESLMAIVLFSTVVVGVLNTIGNAIGSPRTKLLQAALVMVEDELARLSTDNLVPETVVSGKLLMKRIVVQKQLYAEVTLTVSPADDETRVIIAVTKFVLLKDEE